MPKITISGSHSTGKSTVVDALKKIQNLNKRFTFKGEILRDIKRSGHNINEYGSNDTQLLVLSKFLEYSTMQDTIFDRCALDGLAYTAYLYEKNQVTKNTLRIAESIFENTKYDIMFYIAPEFDIVPDGVRSENVEFRDRVAQIFEEYIESYNINIIRLTGNVDERVKQFTDVIDMYDRWLEAEKKEQEEFIKELKKLK